jgi:hypothetical protein
MTTSLDLSPEPAAIRVTARLENSPGFLAGIHAVPGWRLIFLR